ncbi:hypothetical protein V8E36_004815 [Tilletia maclaganii]
MFALVKAAFWQQPMLLQLFIVVVLLSSRSDSRSFTIPLQQANHSVFFQPNGSLDAIRFAGHTRYIRHMHCLAQQKNRLCEHETLPLRRQESGQLSIHGGAFGAAPTMTIAVGGQTLPVIFDTTALVSVVDPVHYLPERSSSAHHLQLRHLVRLVDGRTAEMIRWKDLISIAGLNAFATFDRSEQRIFDPSISAAGGVLAFSKHDATCQNPTPIIYVLQQELRLDRPIFSFSLPRYQYFGGPLEADGKLTIGDFDRDRGRRNQALRYFPFEPGPRYRNLWATRGKINNHSGVMILNTVSAFIILPIQLARTLFAELNLRTEEVRGSLLARYPCASYLYIDLRIGEKPMFLRRSSLQFGDQHEGQCTLSIIGDYQEEITLGRPFFESVYTVIDLSGWLGFSRA